LIIAAGSLGNLAKIDILGRNIFTQDKISAAVMAGNYHQDHDLYIERLKSKTSQKISAVEQTAIDMQIL
jgi:hypothetical protein